MKVFFTVLITTYNRAGLLPRAIESVLKQTYRNFELIVVDDCSPDHTSHVITQYADKIKYMRNAHNQGVSASRNIGIAAAQGEYIAFLDDDDAYDENFLSEVHQHLLAYQEKLAFTWTGKRVITCSDGQQNISRERTWHSDSIHNIAPHQFITSWANSNGVVIKKSVLQTFGGFDERMNKAEDLDLLLRMLAQSCHYAAVPKILINVYIDPHAESLSRNKNFASEAANLTLLVNKNATFLARYPALWMHYYFSLLGAFYRSGQRKLARQIAKKMLLKRPYSIKLWSKMLEFEVLKKHRYPSTGKLYIVAAPSGAGKSSLVNMLTQRLSNTVVSISYTTRPPRPGEKEGDHYHFVSQEKFEAMIKQGAFLEYAKVFAKVANHYYGTPRQWVETQLAAGKNVVLEIDWQGTRQVFEKCPAAVGIFILPPSLAVLEERLKKRAQDNAETIQRRMSVAQDEISHYRDYHYLIVNDDFDQALSELVAIFQGQRKPIDTTAPQLTPELQQLLDKLLA